MIRITIWQWNIQTCRNPSSCCFYKDLL